jgi:hypothetical protein
MVAPRDQKPCFTQEWIGRFKELLYPDRLPGTAGGHCIAGRQDEGWITCRCSGRGDPIVDRWIAPAISVDQKGEGCISARRLARSSAVSLAILQALVVFRIVASQTDRFLKGPCRTSLKSKVEKVESGQPYRQAVYGGFRPMPTKKFLNLFMFSGERSTNLTPVR